MSTKDRSRLAFPELRKILAKRFILQGEDHQLQWESGIYCWILSCHAIAYRLPPGENTVSNAEGPLLSTLCCRSEVVTTSLGKLGRQGKFQKLVLVSYNYLAA